MPNRRWTKDEDATLRREWARGTVAKVIADMVDRHYKAIYLRRLKLKLLRRQIHLPKGESTPKDLEGAANIYFGNELMGKAKLRAMSLGLNFSRYLSNLVKRDLGL